MNFAKEINRMDEKVFIEDGIIAGLRYNSYVLDNENEDNLFELTNNNIIHAGDNGKYPLADIAKMSDKDYFKLFHDTMSNEEMLDWWNNRPDIVLNMYNNNSFNEEVCEEINSIKASKNNTICKEIGKGIKKPFDIRDKARAKHGYSFKWSKKTANKRIRKMFDIPTGKASYKKEDATLNYIVKFS